MYEFRVSFHFKFSDILKRDVISKKGYFLFYIKENCTSRRLEEMYFIVPFYKQNYTHPLLSFVKHLKFQGMDSLTLFDLAGGGGGESARADFKR